MKNQRLSQEIVESYLESIPDVELTGKVPVEEGIKDVGLDSPSMEELKKMPALKRVDLSDSLSSLSNDFVFFNHTMLFSKGGLDFDPLTEYQGWCGKDSVVNYMVFNRQIFDNFDFPDRSGGHDKLLAFTSIEHWPVIERAIGHLTILNRSKDYMFLCEAVKVKIPDPKKPTMFIEPYVWNLKGSVCSWTCSGYPVPRLVKKPADYEAKRLMRAINNEPLDP
jgi:hypothetical protein